MPQKKRRGRPPIPAATRMRIVDAYLEIRRRTGAPPSTEDVKQELELSRMIVPSTRSIQRVLQQFREREDETAAQDAVLGWLDLDQAQLPADSVATLLEAVKVISERQRTVAASGLEEERRKIRELGASDEVMERISGPHFATDMLTIRYARWIWRVHNAIPDDSMDTKLFYASILTRAEQMRDLFGEAPDIGYVMGLLAYRPWSSPEARTAWEQAIARGSVPPTLHPDELEMRRILGMLRYSYRADPHWAELMELLIENSSGGLSDEGRDALRALSTQAEDSRRRGAVG